MKKIILLISSLTICTTLFANPDSCAGTQPVYSNKFTYEYKNPRAVDESEGWSGMVYGWYFGWGWRMLLGDQAEYEGHVKGLITKITTIHNYSNGVHTGSSVCAEDDIEHNSSSYHSWSCEYNHSPNGSCIQIKGNQAKFSAKFKPSAGEQMFILAYGHNFKFNDTDLKAPTVGSASRSVTIYINP